MATTLDIAPSLGHPVVSAQGQPGGYDAIDDRAFWGLGLQEGAVESGAYKVTERDAGANMSVDVAAAAGHLTVQGDVVSHQGLYLVRPHATTANLDIPTADPSDPRIDQVVVEVDDDEHDASGLSEARLYVLEGAPTTGATLDNRSGAAALPDTCIRLADVLVGAGATSIESLDIRDRRPWARGLFTFVESNSDYQTTNTSYQDITPVSFDRRVEATGRPILAEWIGLGRQSVGSAYISMLFMVDNTPAGHPDVQYFTMNTAGREQSMHFRSILTPSAGSHLIKPQYRVNTGTGTLRGSGIGQFFMLRELPGWTDGNGSV